ncbi:iron-containing alcohol dehydrogenase [Clostridium sp. LBM24168]
MRSENMFSFYMPTRLYIGRGSLDMLGKVHIPGKRALIVTTSGNSVKKYGYLKKVQELLNSQNIKSILYDRVMSNPTRFNVMEGAKLARENDCDIIIGLGGGSAIDTAKCIAAMTINPGDLWDYIAAGTGKSKVPPNGALPIIAIPTTAGTGSEADPWAVTTNEKTREKIDFGDDNTFPYFSIIDPDLMATIPQKLTAYQGFDALFHSTEGFIANVANPISDALSIKAIEIISKYLPRAVLDGCDKEARSNIAVASTISGIVESISNCTSEHSIEHALSGFHPDLPHGAGLIAISIAYYENFLDVARDKYILMAKAMGEDLSFYSDDRKQYGFISALKRLQRACGVHNIELSKYGVERNRIGEYTQLAYDTMGELFEMDPRNLSFEETYNIIEKSLK